MTANLDRARIDRATEPLNVLILCTGNSARSILAEALVNRIGAYKLRGFSAGSHPKGTVHPLALQLLQQHGYDTAAFRSKSWDEFAAPGAPAMDFVFTVCDSAAAEVCPVWPGQPVTAHWGIPDPAAAEGSDVDRMFAFVAAYRALERRIGIFASLPFAKLSQKSLQQRVRAIANEADAKAAP